MFQIQTLGPCILMNEPSKNKQTNKQSWWEQWCGWQVLFPQNNYKTGQMSKKLQPFQGSRNWPKAYDSLSIDSWQLTELRVGRVSLWQCCYLDLPPSHAPCSPLRLCHCGNIKAGQKRLWKSALHRPCHRGLSWLEHSQSTWSFS